MQNFSGKRDLVHVKDQQIYQGVDEDDPPKTSQKYFPPCERTQLKSQENIFEVNVTVASQTDRLGTLSFIYILYIIPYICLFRCLLPETSL